MRQRPGGDDAAVLRAALAQDARQLARVDVGDADDVRLAQISRQILRAAPVRREARQIADDEPGGENAPRLRVVGIDADVADVRIRQRDDLTRIRGIGEDLLVAGHRRVEHDLAGCMAHARRSTRPRNTVPSASASNACCCAGKERSGAGSRGLHGVNEGLSMAVAMARRALRARSIRTWKRGRLGLPRSRLQF